MIADGSFGHGLHRDTRRVIEENGGKVLGSVNVPLNSVEFSSYVLQAPRNQEIASSSTQWPDCRQY
ncbi:MAG: hypothetical protein JO081_16830 [Alphaproteobacteria bacterium]|nr:hypothetical protein [Alphaproteobacteria bacterium]